MKPQGPQIAHYIPLVMSFQKKRKATRRGDKEEKEEQKQE